MNNNERKSTKPLEHRKTNIIVNIRNVILFLLALSTVQFDIGMTMNLDVNLPVKNLGALQSLIYFGGHFGLVLAHIINGIAILITSLVFLALSFKTHFLSLRILAILILAFVIDAIINGMLFLMSGQYFGWSIGMAMDAVFVLIISAVAMYFVGNNIQSEWT